MLQRSSSVKKLHVTSASLSSIIQLGDSTVINGFSRAIAVQKEQQLFIGDSVDFSRYPIFRRPFVFPQENEQLTISTYHLNPIISVNTINVMGVSASSVLHIGNTQSVNMEARVKHIRELLPKRNR